jgi:hypothetical protein
MQSVQKNCQRRKSSEIEATSNAISPESSGKKTLK